MFQRNYLSRYVTTDTSALYRGLDPQTVVIRTASGMTRSIDLRRPRALTEGQLAEVERHSEVRLLRGSKSLARRIRAAHGTIANTKGTAIFEEHQTVYRRHQSIKKAAHPLTEGRGDRTGTRVS